MATRRKVKEKPPMSANMDGSVINDNDSTTVNPTTEKLVNQEDLSETQAYQANGNYKQPLSDEVKSRHWLFIVYDDSAPENWREQLDNTGLAWVESPYHDKDKNPEGDPKKPHRHLIVSYPNTTTYRSIKTLRHITKGPFPLNCHSVKGSYDYLIHRQNPEKYQYDIEDVVRHNGWELPVDGIDVQGMVRELTALCFAEDIRDYGELITETMFMDKEYQTVAQRNTVYFNAFLTSYRHAPEKVLTRYIKRCKDEDQRAIMQARLYALKGVKVDPETGEIMED